MFGFQLGREWKLSIAEIVNLFPEANIIYNASGILVLDNISKENLQKNVNNIGGTIKIFELNLFPNLDDVFDFILKKAENTDGKFKYSLNLFGEKRLKLEAILKKIKFLLKNNNISNRYFNKDNGKNLSSGQIIGNSILKKGYDFNLVDIGNIYYFGKTIWVQDIESYKKRDFSKNRDMQIGMLPPKLCQIMINIGASDNKVFYSENHELGSKNCNLKNIYDPFTGLGTVLIEALNMGINNVFGSDLNENMVKASKENLKNFIEKLELKANYSIAKLNAKFINESPFFEEKIDLIVTEGYLGEIMTKSNISLERINKQKENLTKLYSAFFSNLKKSNFNGKIVICFPFWELNKKYIYFFEILNIIQKSDFKIEKIFKNKDLNFSTKAGSLLYKRGNQLVGREIFKLSIKK